MISEVSCDTEDWSNDAENSALKSHKLHFKTLKLKTFILNIFTILLFLYCIFDQLHVVLVSRPFKNITKLLLTPKFEQCIQYVYINAFVYILLLYIYGH